MRWSIRELVGRESASILLGYAISSNGPFYLVGCDSQADVGLGLRIGFAG
jgi:hypothetical protein